MRSSSESFTPLGGPRFFTEEAALSASEAVSAGAGVSSKGFVETEAATGATTGAAAGATEAASFLASRPAFILAMRSAFCSSVMSAHGFFFAFFSAAGSDSEGAEATDAEEDAFFAFCSAFFAFCSACLAATAGSARPRRRAASARASR